MQVGIYLSISLLMWNNAYKFDEDFMLRLALE